MTNRSTTPWSTPAPASTMRIILFLVILITSTGCVHIKSKSSNFDAKPGDLLTLENDALIEECDVAESTITFWTGTLMKKSCLRYAGKIDNVQPPPRSVKASTPVRVVKIFDQSTVDSYTEYAIIETLGTRHRYIINEIDFQFLFKHANNH